MQELDVTGFQLGTACQSAKSLNAKVVAERFLLILAPVGWSSF